MKLRRRVLVSLTLLGTLAVPMVAMSAPAQALPTCNTSTMFGNDRFYYHLPTANGDRNCVMGRGSVSAAVRTLQGALNACYNQGLVVDGNYGAATERAVRNVQAAVGAGVDGVYGPETRSRMNWFVQPTTGCTRVG